MRVVIAQPCPPCMHDHRARGRHDGFEVGVVEDDVRRLAAELEEDALQRLAQPRAMMCLPTAVEPVNEIMSTRGSPVSTSPTVGRVGRRHDVEHAGREVGLLARSACRSTSRSTACRARASAPPCSPPASAGTSFDRFSMNGKFHGVIEPDHADRLAHARAGCSCMPKNSWTPSSRSHSYGRAGRCPTACRRCSESCWTAYVSTIGVPTSATICGAQLLRCFVERLLAAGAGTLRANAGSSTSRSRRRRGAPRRSRGPCPRAWRRRPGR